MFRSSNGRTEFGQAGKAGELLTRQDFEGQAEVVRLLYPGLGAKDTNQREDPLGQTAKCFFSQG